MSGQGERHGDMTREVDWCPQLPCPARRARRRAARAPSSTAARCHVAAPRRGRAEGPANRCSLRRRAHVVPYRQPPERLEGRAIPKRTGSTDWSGSKEPVRPIQDPVVRSPSSAVVVAAEEHDKSIPSPTHFRHCGGIVLTAGTCRRARAPSRLPSCRGRRDDLGRGRAAALRGSGPTCRC